MKRHYEKFKEKFALKGRLWREKMRRENPQVLFLYDKRRRCKKRGITVTEFDSIIHAQGYKCAVCGTTNPGNKKDWSIDHDHFTNKHRGLLCGQCNVGLGMFRDSTAVLRCAAEYLDAWSQKNTLSKSGDTNG
jgi:hypothetical protein